MIKSVNCRLRIVDCGLWIAGKLIEMVSSEYVVLKLKELRTMNELRIVLVCLFVLLFVIFFSLFNFRCLLFSVFE